MSSGTFHPECNDGVQSIVDEWDSVRRKHPMLGEKISPESLASIWEDASGTYSEKGYDAIRDSIVDYLVDNHQLTTNDTVVDIGCGHGAFAIPLSRHVRSILCTDISRGMLARVESADICNIRTRCTDCFDQSPGLVADISFSSLCPPMNCSRGIFQMERMARRRCIYISSANSCPGIETEVWNALGEDYTYAGSNPEYPYRFLRAIGRSPVIRFFSQTSEQSVSVDEITRRMISKLSKYRFIDSRSRKIIGDVINSHSEDGIVYQKTEMVLGLLVWDKVSE